MPRQVVGARLRGMAMTQDRAAESLILRIYDVITDTRRWPEVLDRLAAYMGAEAAGLGYVDRVHCELESLWLSSRLAGLLDEEHLAQTARGVRQFAQFT